MQISKLPSSFEHESLFSVIKALLVRISKHLLKKGVLRRRK